MVEGLAGRAHALVDVNIARITTGHIQQHLVSRRRGLTRDQLNPSTHQPGQVQLQSCDVE